MLGYMMSKLSELSDRMVRGYAGVRAPELRLHPDAKSFNMRFPIIMKDIREMFGPNTVYELLNNDLTKIIKLVGDTQNRKTNVKADMTDWFMQREYPIFNSVGDIAIKFAQEASPCEVQLELCDIWGAIYKRGDFTKAHDHWPHPWSFSYYVKSDGTTPIAFPDSPCYFYPKTNDIVLFPGILRHSVPIHESDEERIIVSGNIDIKYS
jgi:hypothetical protein